MGTAPKTRGINNQNRVPCRVPLHGVDKGHYKGSMLWGPRQVEQARVCSPNIDAGFLMR